MQSIWCICNQDIVIFGELFRAALIMQLIGLSIDKTFMVNYLNKQINV